MVAWDGSFDVYVALGDKYCTTADDGVGMGVGVRGKTINPLVMPLVVEPKYNGNLRLIRVHIKRSPPRDPEPRAGYTRVPRREPDRQRKE